MARIKKFNPKRTFKGKKEHKSNSRCSISTSTDSMKVSPKTSSSYKKLKHAKIRKDFDEETGMDVIVYLELISMLVQYIAKCKFRGSENSLVLRLDEQFKSGLAHRIIIKCSFCDENGKEMSSKCIRNMHEINIIYAHVLRSIGRSKAHGNIFSAVMNLSPPNTKFEKYNAKLLAAVAEVCESSMRHAAK
ncbi:hypothetical protein PR048_032286 [Dryococelus australis]|uniref:Uncharacterized protein n=1 Tax=Dryococelus australis TaxID=614101 RepID=A0ABQ9G4Z8_9NEOP|nr:hypothetical protein PR048_032286 [Dryococelus australis]